MASSRFPVKSKRLVTVIQVSICRAICPLRICNLIGLVSMLCGIFWSLWYAQIFSASSGSFSIKRLNRKPYYSWSILFISLIPDQFHALQVYWASSSWVLGEIDAAARSLMNYQGFGIHRASNSRIPRPIVVCEFDLAAWLSLIRLGWGISLSTKPLNLKPKILRELDEMERFQGLSGVKIITRLRPRSLDFLLVSLGYGVGRAWKQTLCNAVTTIIWWSVISHNL